MREGARAAITARKRSIRRAVSSMASRVQKAHVGGDLIVAAPPGVQAPAGLADP
ncbi:MAG: hypothetical protein M5U28_39390 [Sandaracinaceae bacterium]|nr:hypothetical protein [Sandaracinaceae bacterium]